MAANNFAFPRTLGSGDDPFIGLIEVANLKYPGFIKSVIDGGAGVGSFVDRVLKGTTGCRVIAYEPLPENAKVLRSRFSGVSAVDIREAALGDRVTQVSFEVPERKGIPNSLWTPGTSYGGHVRRSGILPLIKGIARKLLRRGSRLQPQHRQESILVRMTRLDAELNVPPDLVKLDLQGGEPEALKGLGNLLPQVKVAKIEIQMLGGDARTQCARIFRDAGFNLYIEDLQFSVPQMTDTLRQALNQIGIEIEYEGRLSPSDPQIMIKGSWPTDRPLPIQDLDLSTEFANVLLRAKASYFQVDLVALNGRYSEQWKSLLPSELLEKSGMKLNAR